MSPWLALLLVIGLIAANGLFVAAEFALVSVRRGAIEERAAAGERRAQLALQHLQRLSFLLSGAQFGITATSLLVGFLAEDAIGETLLDPLIETFGLPEQTSAAVSVAGAFLLSTMVQMIFGELAPKNVAISRPEPVSLGVAGFMRGFGVVFGPIIRIFDGAAAAITRALGIEVSEELIGGHSLDELSRIIEASGEEGALSQHQAELLLRAVELGDRRVIDVMIPRPDVRWLRANDPLDALRETARQTGHSRFPVHGETEDDIVGTVHIKDLLTVGREREHPPERVGELAAAPLIVPETEPLRRLLSDFRRERRTFAVVVDEFGGVAGIVTVEDVLEELVGEIEDEFDRDIARIRRLGAGTYVVRGTLRAADLEHAIGMELPEGDYETVAGFVIERLGHLPGEGESVRAAGWEFEVSRVEGVRVVELKLRLLPEDQREEGRP